MNYLLDTHYLLWALADSKKISTAVKETIANPENRVIVSTVSFWEVSLKIAKGKLKISGFFPEDLPTTCLKIGFEIESLSPEDSSSYHKLNSDHHKDPFDRMLIWQAIRNNYVFISNDKNVKKYRSDGLKIYK